MLKALRFAPMTCFQELRLSDLPGVSERAAARFHLLGIHSATELLGENTATYVTSNFIHGSSASVFPSGARSCAQLLYLWRTTLTSWLRK